MVPTSSKVDIDTGRGIWGRESVHVTYAAAAVLIFPITANRHV